MANNNEQSVRQIDRFLKKVVQKFPCDEENACLTDIHIRISPESGDLMAFDDEDKEITRSVVEEWIECRDDNFYDVAVGLLRERLNTMAAEIDRMGLLKPFSFVLENDDKEHVAELFVSDDDINILGGDIMDGWDKDLDKFFDELMKRTDNPMAWHEENKNLDSLLLPRSLTWMRVLCVDALLLTCIYACCTSKFLHLASLSFQGLLCLSCAP